MIQELIKGIFSVGANHPDRREFDSLFYLPEGTSYNSYLIKGKTKTALIDTVEPSKAQVLVYNLQRLKIKKIDYVIANHAEQDHSGSLPIILKKYPRATVLCSEKCAPLLTEMVELKKSRIRIVNDREKIDLGGKTLEFIYFPWVHWPETMVTYLHEDKILFSCDLFGSHLGADDLLASDPKKLDYFLKMYFAQIMMPFREVIKMNLPILDNYHLEMIAPSHGPVHTKPEAIIKKHKEWVSDKVKNIAVIAYVSMHHSTQKMAEHLAKQLEKKGVSVHLHDISEVDVGEIMIDVVDAATLILGTPCYLSAIHPKAMYTLYNIAALRPKTKYFSVLGSYGWAGRITEEILPMLKGVKMELISPVVIKGAPRKIELQQLDKLANVIAEKHKLL